MARHEGIQEYFSLLNATWDEIYVFPYIATWACLYYEKHACKSAGNFLNDEKHIRNDARCFLNAKKYMYSDVVYILNVEKHSCSDVRDFLNAEKLHHIDVDVFLYKEYQFLMFTSYFLKWKDAIFSSRLIPNCFVPLPIMLCCLKMSN